MFAITLSILTSSVILVEISIESPISTLVLFIGRWAVAFGGELSFNVKLVVMESLILPKVSFAKNEILYPPVNPGGLNDRLNLFIAD